MSAGWPWLLPVLLGCGLAAAAQEAPRPAVDLPLLIQELVARPENEALDYEDLYESLFQYY
jgi:hypothetical protein